MRTIPVFLAVCLLLVVSLSAGAQLAVVSNSERQLTLDSAEETEPALSSSTNRTVSVFMRFDPNLSAATGQPRLHWSAYGTLFGLTSSGEFPLVQIPGTSSYYDKYYDPVLAYNPATYRTYLAAFARGGTSSRAIVLWYSDNGGFTWSSLPTIITTSSTVDKPHITVGPDGKVWIVWVEVLSGVNQLKLYSSSNATGAGGTTATLPIPDAGDPHAPQVMVDEGGDAWVLFTDVNPGRIRLGRWRNNSWLQMPNVPGTGTLLNSAMPVGGLSLKAVTVPVARIDRSRSRLSVAWHENDGNGVAIKFATALYSPNWTTVAWYTTTISSGKMEYHVGMDINPSTGAAVVTYYSFGNGSTATYRQEGAYVYFNGAQPIAESPVGISGYSTLNSELYSTIDAMYHLGEYHDVTFSGSTWKTVGTVISGSASDLKVWELQR